MKSILIAIMTTVSLVGCANMQPPKDIVVKYKYVVNTIPEEMLTVPPQVPAIDITTADDITVGGWMLDGEKRSLEIEGKLKSIKDLQDKRLLDLKALPAEDVIIK